jgi:lysophospholipase L1-like esterase
LTRAGRAAAVAGALALAGSLGANVFLAHAVVDYVHTDDAVRLDPAGLDVYASARAKPTEPGPPIVEFFGDSRIAMWPEPAVTGYRTINRGVGFQTTAQLLLRFDAEVTAFRPAVVVLEGGVNDLKTIPEFPERRAEVVARCKANLSTLVDRSRRAGAQVVLMTIFDIGNVPLWRKPFWSADVEAAVREVNAFLPQLTGDKVVLFDSGAALDDPPGEIRHDFQLDHLHLKTAGYTALDERLVPLLVSLPR